MAMSNYGHSALNIRRVYSTDRYPAIYVIMCVAEKNGSFSSFFFSNKHRRLCSVINVLHNKTIIPPNLAEYRLTLGNSAYGLVG